MAFSIPTEERAESRFPGPKFWRNFSTITAVRRKKNTKPPVVRTKITAVTGVS